MANLIITNDRMLSVRNAAQAYINQHKDRTHFHVALEKFLKHTKNAIEEYADKENDICVDTALKENKKFVYETTPRGEKILAVDPDKAKQKQRDMRALGREEIQVAEYFVKDENVPDDLEAAWMHLFLGVIIKNDPLEETKPEMVLEKGEDILSAK